MQTRTHFAHRIDIWDDSGEHLIEHVAGARTSSGSPHIRRCADDAEGQDRATAGCASGAQELGRGMIQGTTASRPLATMQPLPLSKKALCSQRCEWGMVATVRP